MRASFSPLREKFFNFSKHNPATVKGFNIKTTIEEAGMKYVAVRPFIMHPALSAGVNSN
jgi:hypothetical protein